MVQGLIILHAGAALKRVLPSQNSTPFYVKLFQKHAAGLRFEMAGAKAARSRTARSIPIAITGSARNFFDLLHQFCRPQIDLVIIKWGCDQRTSRPVGLISSINLHFGQLYGVWTSKDSARARAGNRARRKDIHVSAQHA